jgi:hypothetical protein
MTDKMNERLRELMIQADYPAPELALRAHRLAELIVAECMQVVANQLPSNQYLDVAHAVIEHFGVEQ